jgi:hypothetical protein
MLPVLVRELQLQVRVHEGRLLHHLHQRRQGCLRLPASLLRSLRQVLRKWLHLLRVLQWHTGLLLHLLSTLAKACVGKHEAQGIPAPGLFSLAHGFWHLKPGFSPIERRLRRDYRIISCLLAWLEQKRLWTRKTIF